MRHEYDKLKKLIFDNYFSNFNFSITMAYTKFKLCVLILTTHLVGTVSQVFVLGLSFYFMPKIGTCFQNFVS